MNGIVQNSLIMFGLLVAAVSLVVVIIRFIAGKGIIVTISTWIAATVALDCELAFILGQIGMTPAQYGAGFLTGDCP